MNFQTFSSIAFALRSPLGFWVGSSLALVMGVLGGLLPAVRAAIRPVAVALREL